VESKANPERITVNLLSHMEDERSSLLRMAGVRHDLPEGLPLTSRSDTSTTGSFRRQEAGAFNRSPHYPNTHPHPGV